MIHLKHVTTVEGEIVDLQLAGNQTRVIDAHGLTLLPGLIDPHVHFRTPGLEHKENWESGARAAIQGGITMVLDMPNTLPATITLERVKEKRELINTQLKRAGIGLRYGLYLGADKGHFEEIARCKDQVVAIKLFMGSSTGDLLMDDLSSLHAVFCLAAAHDLLLAVHAEDEALIHQRSNQLKGDHPRMHSIIRNEEVALKATVLALELARVYGTRLYLLHISTKAEVEAIRRAKEAGVVVFAETTPHHLFLTTQDYEMLGTKVQMNPPIRSVDNCEALWKAINEGVIDTIGSDHAPHTLEEKARAYGKAPSGIPGVETTLPLLLNACHHGRLSLQKIVSLMHTRILEIFRFKSVEDYVLIDRNKVRSIDEAHLKTKCGWSPYTGRTLTGWPVYTILQGHVHDLN
jgi:dihydroorotase